MLRGNSAGTELAGEEFDLLRDLLDKHPESADKIGEGVAVIWIAPPMAGTRYQRFALIRTDGTPMDFSYLECFTPSRLDSQVRNVMRFEIIDKTTAYFEARFNGGTFTSDESFTPDESGVPLQRSNTAVSYFQGPSFKQITGGFAAAEGGWEAIELTSSADVGPGRFVDRDQAERWRAHWEQHAVLGLLTEDESRARSQA